MYTDRTITCVDCKKTFVFTAGEQEFYASKGFSSDPRRCPECRRKRKESNSQGNRSGAREMHEVVCANCGVTTQVPFRPRGDRPVLCSNCFKESRGEQAT